MIRRTRVKSCFDYYGAAARMFWLLVQLNNIDLSKQFQGACRSFILRHNDTKRPLILGEQLAFTLIRHDYARIHHCWPNCLIPGRLR
jgi:hypothetical protein